MMVHGWCVKCKRIRRVRLANAWNASAGPIGVCTECEDKEKDK